MIGFVLGVRTSGAEFSTKVVVTDMAFTDILYSKSQEGADSWCQKGRGEEGRAEEQGR